LAPGATIAIDGALADVRTDYTLDWCVACAGAWRACAACAVQRARARAKRARPPRSMSDGASIAERCQTDADADACAPLDASMCTCAA